MGRTPKKLNVIIIIVAFILFASKESVEIYDDVVKTKIDIIELELKENELYQQLMQQRRIKPEFRRITTEARKIIEYISDDTDIIYFEFDGVIIKGKNR